MKAAKEQEPDKLEEKQEDPVEEESVAAPESRDDSNGNLIDEDELIIKDDIDNDCFEDVDHIGIIGEANEKENEAPVKEKNEEKQEEIKADDSIEISNHDNEDSLNLTIGEEEEQLLRDEENDVKAKGSSISHTIFFGVGFLMRFSLKTKTHSSRIEI